MNYEHKKNKGSLFKNDKKELETHPDYKGSGDYEGEQCWISAWMSKTKDGVPYLSLSFTPKTEQRSVKKDEGINDDLMPF